ncbi:hypothetical protein QTO34_009794 [Cnephaeus nilssonii]|uniref:Uncharacterized protein n=1 Tax=Cnephaeus nilssonii TaxID=3371016 RepID=A0AA40LEU7_CNENI|nr:hypothetical protein QTO34_009794 [Eptesicus nilssonii]
MIGDQLSKSERRHPRTVRGAGAGRDGVPSPSLGSHKLLRSRGARGGAGPGDTRSRGSVGSASRTRCPEARTRAAADPPQPGRLVLPGRSPPVTPGSPRAPRGPDAGPGLRGRVGEAGRPGPRSPQPGARARPPPLEPAGGAGRAGEEAAPSRPEAGPSRGRRAAHPRLCGGENGSRHLRTRYLDPD